MCNSCKVTVWYSQTIKKKPFSLDCLEFRGMFWVTENKITKQKEKTLGSKSSTCLPTSSESHLVSLLLSANSCHVTCVTFA